MLEGEGYGFDRKLTTSLLRDSGAQYKTVLYSLLGSMCDVAGIGPPLQPSYLTINTLKPVRIIL